MENIGILDPEGKNKNPFTGEEYSKEYKELGKIWSKFPAYEKAQSVINILKVYQVVLIVAETGSGKTVLVPKYMTHALDYKGHIAITLPKQTVTQSAAHFAAKTLDVKLGEQVGYQYKGSPRDAKSNNTKLLYATDGTIKSRLLNDPLLKEFDAVIIDEAHERKVQIDFLLYLLRETIKERPEFKLVIMSATINAEIFESYFSEQKFKKINIGGRTNYPIKSIFLQETLTYNKVLDKGFEIIINILKKDKINEKEANDIIFFVTSSNETFEICRKLSDYLKDKTNRVTIEQQGKTVCLELFAGIKQDKQTIVLDKDLFKKSGDYVRKLVVSTNVAESSLTVAGIKYVIDSGYELLSSFNPHLRAKVLNRELISQAQAKQRMGRTGRTEPGVCYHLYTEDDFKNQMKKYPEPDIRNSDITEECLGFLNLDKIKNIEELLNVFTKFIEPPKEAYFKSAINTLVQMGLVKNDKISKLGQLVANFGANNVMGGTAVIYGKMYRCGYEVMKITSVLEACKNNISSLFYLPKISNNLPKDKQKQIRQNFEKLKRKFNHKYGDHLSILKIYEKFEEISKTDQKSLIKWADDNKVKLKLLKKAKLNFKSNLRKIKEINIQESDIKFNEKIKNLNLNDRILCCLLLGYSLNIGVKKSGNFYKTKFAKDLSIKLDRFSFVNSNKKLPKHIFYTELFMQNNRTTLNVVSKIPKKIIDIFK